MRCMTPNFVMGRQLCARTPASAHSSAAPPSPAIPPPYLSSPRNDRQHTPCPHQGHLPVVIHRMQRGTNKLYLVQYNKQHRPRPLHQLHWTSKMRAERDGCLSDVHLTT